MPDMSLGEIPGGSARLRGYLARPSGAGPWPGVVVVQEVWGVGEVLRRQCDRLADAGYLALAPDLYSDGGARRCLIATFRSLRSGDGKAFADIDAARRELLARSDCTGKVGIIGFCLGGAFALLAATRGFDVASDNYGVPPPGFENMLDGACPVVAAYGGRDRLMPRGVPGKVAKALTAAGVDHELTVYPTAGHSFLNDAPTGPMVLRPLIRVANAGPNPTEAAAAWERIEAFFALHLS